MRVYYLEMYPMAQESKDLSRNLERIFDDLKIKWWRRGTKDEYFLYDIDIPNFDIDIFLNHKSDVAGRRPYLDVMFYHEYIEKYSLRKVIIPLILNIITKIMVDLEFDIGWLIYEFMSDELVGETRAMIEGEKPPYVGCLNLWSKRYLKKLGIDGKPELPGFKTTPIDSYGWVVALPLKYWITRKGDELEFAGYRELCKQTGKK